jgi:hypothetical protein
LPETVFFVLSVAVLLTAVERGPLGRIGESPVGSRSPG